MLFSKFTNTRSLFNYIQYARSSLTLNIINEREKGKIFNHVWMIPGNVYSSNVNSNWSEDDTASNQKTKKKKVIIPRITLLSPENEMSIVTLEMAQKMSSRRNLKLVKILDFDTKTERPTYKLMTNKQYMEEDLEGRKQKKQDRGTAVKQEKLFSISTKISDHDFVTKLNSIVRLLKKKHDIRLSISYDNNKEKAHAMFTQLQTVVKDFSPTVIKTSAGNNLKISLRPNPEGNVKNDSNNESTEESKTKNTEESGS